MIGLDNTTRQEYDLLATPASRATLIAAALTGTVDVKVYDPNGNVMGSGTIPSPWATAADSAVTVGETSDFLVSAAGTPNSAWYLRFESGTRFVKGTFGFNGTDFTWSLPEWQSGQSGALGTVVLSCGETIPVSEADITTATVYSTSDGVKPFTFGQAFKKGDIPAGAYIASADATNFSADIRNYWNDGSVRFAVLSGRANISGGTKVLTISRTSQEPSGVSSGEPDIEASVSFSGITDYLGNPIVGSPNETLSLSSARSNGSIPWSKTTPHLVRTILGYGMSEYHYYVPATDPHLAVWFYVRNYRTGPSEPVMAEVETVVENGWMYVPAPGQRNYTATVSVGGSVRFSGFVRHLQFSRWSRADWVGTDPQVTVIPDMTYLKSTKLVPNWTASAQSATQLNALPMNTYAWANQWNNVAYNGEQQNEGKWVPLRDNGMFIGLLPQWDAASVTTPDLRAIHNSLGHARTAGRYSINHRDETTGRPPLLVSAHPQAGLSAVNNSSEYAPRSTLLRFPAPANVCHGGHKGDNEHNPAFGFFAYLLSGRWQYLEADQFCANWFLLWVGTSGGAPRGVSHMETARGLAWSHRSLAIAATMSPERLGGASLSSADAAVRSEFINAITASFTWNNDLRKSPGYANNLGFPSSILPIGDNPYAGHADDFGFGLSGQTNYFHYASFQIHFMAQSFAWMRSIELPVATVANTALTEYSNALLTYETGLFGTNSTFNYRYAEEYTLPLAAGSLYDPRNRWLNSWADVFSVMIGAVQAYVSTPGDHPVSDAVGGTFLWSPTDGGAAQPTNVAYTSIPAAEPIANYWFVRARPALAYAAEFGFSGGSDAYNRFVSSQTTIDNAADFLGYPAHFVSPRATDTYIEGVSRDLANNSWSGDLALEMPTINTTVNGVYPNEGVVGDTMIDWAGAMRWSDSDNSLLIAGSPANTQSNASATNVLKYDSEANTWTATRNPWGVSVTHCYDSTAVNPTGRRLYKRRFNNAEIYALDLDTMTSAGMFAAPSESYSGDTIAVTTLGFFPTMGTQGSLVQAWGRLTSSTGRIFTCDTTTLGTWVNRGGRELGIEYGCLSCYVPAVDRMLIVGGTGSTSAYTLDSQGNVLPAASLPAGVYPSTNIEGANSGHGILVPHPTQPKALLFYKDKSIREYSFATNSWSLIGSIPDALGQPTRPPSAADDYLFDTTAGAIPDVGVLFCQSRGGVGGSSVVYLYKP